MINCACRGSPLRIAVAFARFNYWDSERARQLHCMAAPAGHAARKAEDELSVSAV